MLKIFFIMLPDIPWIAPIRINPFQNLAADKYLDDRDYVAWIHFSWSSEDCGKHSVLTLSVVYLVLLTVLGPGQTTKSRGRSLCPSASTILGGQQRMPRWGSLGRAVWSILVLGLGLPMAASPKPTVSADSRNPCAQGQQCPGLWPFVSTHQTRPRAEEASLRWLGVVRDQEGHSLELSQPTKNPFPHPTLPASFWNPDP